jgi:hypothetical protein
MYKAVAAGKRDGERNGELKKQTAEMNIFREWLDVLVHSVIERQK